MDNTQTKLAAAIAIIIIIVATAYFILRRPAMAPTPEANQTPAETSDSSSAPVVENTAPEGGVMQAPAGFPSDLPYDKLNIVESNTVTFPSQGAKQLSVSYKSADTVTAKYAEYKAYMTKAGYSISENSTGEVKSIFGSKDDANLSVAISSTGGETLVQISYLIKPVSK